MTTTPKTSTTIVRVSRDNATGCTVVEYATDLTAGRPEVHLKTIRTDSTRFEHSARVLSDTLRDAAGHRATIFTTRGAGDVVDYLFNAVVHDIDPFFSAHPVIVLTPTYLSGTEAVRVGTVLDVHNDNARGDYFVELQTVDGQIAVFGFGAHNDEEVTLRNRIGALVGETVTLIGKLSREI